MQILRVVILALIVLFFIGNCSTARNRRRHNSAEWHYRYSRGMTYAVQGKFKLAGREFLRIPSISKFYTLTKTCSEVIEAVRKNRIKKKKAVCLFREIVILMER